jgi:hypothetical protein
LRWPTHEGHSNIKPIAEALSFHRHVSLDSHKPQGTGYSLNPGRTSLAALVARLIA